MFFECYLAQRTMSLFLDARIEFPWHSTLELESINVFDFEPVLRKNVPRIPATQPGVSLVKLEPLD